MDDYGQAGLAALDNPYGLTPRAPPRPMIVPYTPPQGMPPMMPQPMQPPEPSPRSMFGGSAPLGAMGGPMGVGGSLPPPTVIPFRSPGATNAKGPIVGKDLALGQLVALQRKAESSGNYQAINTQSAGNTASGAYQYTDRTWNGYGGYPKAALAPKQVQDRRFLEDITSRVNKYQGDVFKAIADHYLPAAANNPAVWDTPYSVKTKRGVTVVKPVATYIRAVLKGTPYEGQIDAYIAAHK